MSPLKKIAVHLLAFFLFVFMAILASPDWPHVSRMLSHPYGIEDLIFQMEMVVVFYLNYYVLSTRFYLTKRFLEYAFFVLLLLLLTVVLNSVVMHTLIGPPHHNHPGPPFQKRGLIQVILFNRKFYLFLFTLTVSLVFRLWQRYKLIERENLKSELRLLKAQVNPHFLFNTLNSIYSLSLQKSDKAPEAIVKLSSMMRYVLKEGEGTRVELDKELEYLNDYISLQRLRLTKHVDLHYDTKVEGNHVLIAPMILIPFVENAFKYGVSTESTTSIRIQVECKDKRLGLVVYNTFHAPLQAKQESTELGIRNAAKRLKLIYPNAHDLKIHQTETDFEVNLSIQLND